MIRHNSPPTTICSWSAPVSGRLDTAERYLQPTTPLIFWGPQLLEQTQVSRWGGTRQGGYWIRLVDLDHPITAGLPAGRPAGRPLRVVRQATTFSVSYRSIGQGVHVLARHLVGGDEAVMVAEGGSGVVERSNGKGPDGLPVLASWTRLCRARVRRCGSLTRQWIGHSASPDDLPLRRAAGPHHAIALYDLAGPSPHQMMGPP